MAAVSGTRRVPNHPGVYSYELRLGPPNRRTRYAVVATVRDKQRWLRGFRTIKDAEAALDELRVSMRGGTYAKAPARLTLGDYLDKRWWPYQQARLRSSESVRVYAVRMRHVKTRLGAVRLMALTPGTVEDFKAQMARDHVGPAMQNAAFDLLRLALNQAVRWELLGRNPCDRIEAPAEPRHERPGLDNATVLRLLALADETPHGAFAYVTVMTGMRWGELIRLRWADVDFAAGLLRIPKAKTESGVRTLAIGPGTVERLRLHRLEQMRYFTDLGVAPPTLVFTTTIGTALMQANFAARWWHPLRTTLGLPSLHFHDLRHVSSTLMARVGAHPRVMQERLGHAQSRTTLEVYTHATAADQAPVAEAMETLLSESLARDE